MNIDEAKRIFNLHDLRRTAWTHHGLGMLQGKLDRSTRIHLWHPLLVTDDMTGARAIHDHRFMLTSHVLGGGIIDLPYTVDLNPLSAGGQHSVWAIPHKEIQTEKDKHGQNAVFLGRAVVERGAPVTYQAGSVYVIQARAWHTTLAYRPAVTLVTREGFDNEPARVLGNGRSGQVDNIDPDLLERVIDDCSKLVEKK